MSLFTYASPSSSDSSCFDRRFGFVSGDWGVSSSEAGGGDAEASLLATTDPSSSESPPARARSSSSMSAMMDIWSRCSPRWPKYAVQGVTLQSGGGKKPNDVANVRRGVRKSKRDGGSRLEPIAGCDAAVTAGLRKVSSAVNPFVDSIVVSCN